MFRDQLPRLYELRDTISEPAPAGAYFQSLDESLAETPQKLKQYRDIEADLQALDQAAWRDMKAAVKFKLEKRLPLRGWEQIFDTLNEAKGYAYLVKTGCIDIRFVPRSEKRTPDLEASASGRRVLCEVKTINVSDQEARRFAESAVSEVVSQLPEGFFNKVEGALNEAAAQMLAYCSDAGTRRIAYVVVNYDDRSHEYEERYRKQLASFLAKRKPPDIEVVWDIKPPFYTSQV